MNVITDDRIYRLQKNLPIIRNLAGWTAEDLGNNIGVTRQTITNLEKSESLTMTKTQYIAIRSVLDYEIAHSKNTTLQDAISVLVDADDLTVEQAQKVQDTVTSITSAKLRRVNDALVLQSMAGLIAALGVISSMTLLKPMKTSSVPKWLKDLMK